MPERFFSDYCINMKKSEKFKVDPAEICVINYVSTMLCIYFVTYVIPKLVPEDANRNLSQIVM